MFGSESILPLLSELPYHVFRRKVEIDFCSREAVVSEQALQRGERDAFLHGGNRKGVSEHVRAHRAVDAGFVGNPFEDTLNSARGHADGVMDGKVSVDQWAYPVGKGNDATLGLGAIDATFAVDHQPVVLPVDVFAGESGKLGHSQAGIEQRPDNEALLMHLTC